LKRVAQPEASLLLYGGSSMHPLFRGGDLLDVVPCDASGARAGDVIAFTDQGGGPVVVHRVVALTDAGLITRGDNNDCLDDEAVREGHLLGRVAAINRGVRRIAVAGGRRGVLVARLVRLRRQVAPFPHGPFRLLLRRLARVSTLLWSRPRAVIFASGEISVTRLVVPGRRGGAR
jgi:signal peptidase I